MHKRDYEALAKVVETNAFLFKSNKAHIAFALDLGGTLAKDNPRFDMAKWLRACMPSFMDGTRFSNPWERQILAAEEEAKAKAEGWQTMQPIDPELQRLLDEEEEIERQAHGNKADVPEWRGGYHN